MAASLDPVAVAGLIAGIIVALFTSVTAPIMLARRVNQEHREDRDADWARQDKVAAHAAEAAALLAANQTEAARLLKANNEQVAETASITQAQLTEIHIAVNSTLTARMTETLDALRAQYALMKRLIVHPNVEERATMLRIAEAIADLEATIADRHPPH